MNIDDGIRPKHVKDRFIVDVRDKFYSPLRYDSDGYPLPWCHSGGLTQIIASAAAQYLVNFRNHITTNINRRVFGYTRAMIRAHTVYPQDKHCQIAKNLIAGPDTIATVTDPFVVEPLLSDLGSYTRLWIANHLKELANGLPLQV